MILLCNGCSHTKGAEHKHETFYPEVSTITTAWPHVLGDYLGLKTINMGFSGASNQQITRTTIQAIEKYGDKISLVGIMWTGFNRTEFRFKNIFRRNLILKDIGTLKFFSETDYWVFLNPTSKINNKKLVKLNNHWYEVYYDKEGHFVTNIVSIIALQYVLEKHNIPYFFHFLERPTDIESQYKVFYNQINQDVCFELKDKLSFLEWGIANNYKVGPRGTHLLESCHYDFIHQHLGPWVKEKFEIFLDSNI